MGPGRGEGPEQGAGPHQENWKNLVGLHPTNRDRPIHHVQSKWEGVRVYQLAVICADQFI